MHRAQCLVPGAPPLPASILLDGARAPKAGWAQTLHPRFVGNVQKGNGVQALPGQPAWLLLGGGDAGAVEGRDVAQDAGGRLHDRKGEDGTGSLAEAQV